MGVPDGRGVAQPPPLVMLCFVADPTPGTYCRYVPFEPVVWTYRTLSGVLVAPSAASPTSAARPSPSRATVLTSAIDTSTGRRATRAFALPMDPSASCW